MHRIVKQSLLIQRHLDSVYARGNPRGSISRLEAEFLMHRILSADPKCIVEIGTAAGASSAHMLKSLELLGNRGKLFAIEYLEHCYFDPSLPVGYVVDEVFPERPAGYALYTGKSSFDLEEILDGEAIDFLFVDGNHSHPWATIDTILALPFLSPNATIAFHDINLHLLDKNKPLDCGAHNAFFYLQGADKVTVAALPHPNIGALQLKTAPAETLRNLITILFHFPWKPNAWPPLDKAFVLRVYAFICAHWGKQEGQIFLKFSHQFGYIQ